MSGDELGRTLAHAGAPTVQITIHRVRLTIVEGPGAGTSHEVSSERIAIGAHALNDLVIEDPTVSRFHCEVRLDGEHAIVADLDSRNGTLVDGVRIREAYLKPGNVLALGAARVRFELAGQDRQTIETRFGSLVGTSPAMRRVLTLLSKAAASDVTLLLQGETGTGKGRAAEAVHRASARAGAPFVTVDCSAIPANLLESELFGHEKGAFTSAHERRIGAFEEASGGTLFLDEIGEMPAELQPKLLRVLENREIRRIGSNRYLPVDLRVIAATNRDLRAEVNANHFRSDLYYRLAVAKITLPSLRDRREDLATIVDELLAQLRVAPAAAQRLCTPAFLANLAHHDWPGNVRELRNHLERCLAFDDEEPAGVMKEPAFPEGQPLPPYTEAKKRAHDAFERVYLTTLLREHGGRVPAAAQAAGVDRVYLYRLLRRQGIKPRS